jgi:cohesin complex subunit SCC1
MANPRVVLADVSTLRLEFDSQILIHNQTASPLTEPAPATPKDAADEDTPVKKAKKRKPKERKQVIDSVTEQNGANFSKSDVSNIITTHPYLSNSIAVMRFQDVLADPLGHFFPSKVTEEGSFICLAPPGMAPELQDLFLFPIKEGAGQKRKGREQGDRASKRPRLDGEDVDEVELLRERASVPFSPGHGDGDAFGADGFQDESGFLPNDSLPIDDFRFEVDDSLHIDKIASSRAQTPGDDLFVGGLGGDEDSRIRMFDTQQTQESQLFSQSQQRDEEAEEEKEKEEANKDGYSRNTVKAIEVLRDELENLPQGKGTLSFAKLTDKVNISHSFCSGSDVFMSAGISSRRI